MSEKNIFLNNIPYHTNQEEPKGDLMEMENDSFFCISNVDRMEPFFMTLVSSSDHWLFISSRGGLSAGRRNENNALFPYYTDDKINEFSDTTGSKTIFQVHSDGNWQLWEPFSNNHIGLYRIERNLYKNVSGSRLIFEEVNHDFQLTFRYSWQFSEKFGFVKKAGLINTGSQADQVEVLDGIQNLLPYGVFSALQNDRSNLVNAYKRNELDRETGLGIFTLSAIIVDRAEPSEALKATTVWSTGIPIENYLLSKHQVDNFRLGKPVETEVDKKGNPGAYFIHAQLDIKQKEQFNWYIVAEVNQDHAQVFDLKSTLSQKRKELPQLLDEDIKSGIILLKNLVAKADGLQLTNDLRSTSRHFSNVLFNIMRGGIFDEDYRVTLADLIDYATTINKKLVKQHDQFFKSLPNELNYQDLIAKAKQSGYPDLFRICNEYLPLTFSRRHGDPSRPWNQFSIETKKPDGSKNRAYQGNWRDIFQNWEALALSFPGFIEGMIIKFLNASTIDGYNPYRISREGIDWEVIEPDNPWSYIGYWGDHQIIYLQKLLEISYSHGKDQLNELLTRPIFVYANVPYRIKSYQEIVKDSQDTIDFDENSENEIHDRVNEFGADGKLVFQSDKTILRATFTEKLLVMLLAKLSNFIPEAGIWLNTQRPEWNDANNALVGNGVSMVTLYYIRRFLIFFKKIYQLDQNETYKVHAPVSEILTGIHQVFNTYEPLLSTRISDQDRKQITDELGRIGERYRVSAYETFDSNQKEIRRDDLLKFIDQALRFVDHSINANRRPDGLYHSYNLLNITEKKFEVNHLYEMLEGQVAVLSSGKLSSKEGLEVLDALKNSKIYREDQYSYLLYPNRELKGFLSKNRIPNKFVQKSALAQKLKEVNNRDLVIFDGEGNCFFNGDFHNASDLLKSLDTLALKGFGDLVKAEHESYLELFERIFDHQSFTGRSGTFFGYEGLGSIYWHMVSKLLLATQEQINHEIDEVVKGKLVDHYYEIRAGIGINKSPHLYGAFPTDPYSHTPFNKGAQQPGMTGQVKEDIINRWAELGVKVRDGALIFKPDFLNETEFLKQPANFNYFDLEDQPKSIPIEPGQLAFTYCQVPIIYHQSKNLPKLRLHYQDGNIVDFDQNILPEKFSREVFNRSGVYTKIEVGIS